MYEIAARRRHRIFPGRCAFARRLPWDVFARRPCLTPYRFVPHTADIAVELRATREKGLYQAGLDALRELLVGADPVSPAEERAITPRGTDPAERLVHFLSDVLYLYDTERFLPAQLSAQGVLGERLDPRRHTVQREVKAVTHHGAAVEHDEDGWRATIIFDV